MTYFLQIFLQGVLEAFPVSSSMHLKFTNISNTEIMHLGTGIAFFIYAIDHLSTYFKKPFSKKTIFFASKIILITLPTIFIGFLFKKQPEFFSIDSVNLICSTTMLAVNMHIPAKKNFKSLNIKQILIIGIIILVAIFPGASRFGVSFTAFRLFQLTKQESFLYAIIIGVPITIGAASLNMYTTTIDTKIIFASLLAGTMTYQTLKLTKKYLEYWNVFSIYRITFSMIHFFFSASEKNNLISYILIALCLLFGIESNQTHHNNKNKALEQKKLKRKNYLTIY